MADHHQVIIVGGGPVGVGLAVDLGLRGISCVVVERRTRLSRIPKGQGLSQRSLEHCHRWGVADEIRAARAMPPGYPIGQVTTYRDLRGEFWQASPSRELVAAYYSQANERLPQYRTEEVLRRRLATLPNVTTRFGWTATAVAQDAEGASVVVERDGARETLTGDYVVGCDGGHSLVREVADIRRSSTDFARIMALVVFRSAELHAALERFPERSTYRVMHPDLHGYWMFFGRVDVGEEFFFHAPVPEGATVDGYDFAALLHRAAGFPFACEIEHVGLWDLRVQIATEYRSGRVFIAGDAAHTHPPYGGFGLNNGLEDATNLGWKLAAALEGWGGERLLDSYTLERQPVFRDVGEGIISGWIQDDRRFLERYSPERDRAEFATRFEQASRGFGERLKAFEPHYEGSPVVCGPPGGVCSGYGVHERTARAGHLLPPCTLSSGRNVFDELGRGFVLLAFDAAEDDVRAFEAAARAQHVPLTVVRDTLADGREDYGVRLALIRPDEYVAWAADAGPDDADGLLRGVTGRD